MKKVVKGMIVRWPFAMVYFFAGIGLHSLAMALVAHQDIHEPFFVVVPALNSLGLAGAVYLAAGILLVLLDVRDDHSKTMREGKLLLDELSVAGVDENTLSLVRHSEHFQKLTNS